MEESDAMVSFSAQVLRQAYVRLTAQYRHVRMAAQYKQDERKQNSKALMLSLSNHSAEGQERFSMFLNVLNSAML